MTVLITGGAGFIGSHLCEMLLHEGCEVICLDNFDPFYSPAIKRQNLSKSLTYRKFHLKVGDVRDRGLLQRLFNTYRVDAVVHLAAKAGVRPSIQSPSEYFNVNVHGTMQLLEAMAQVRAPRILFASSSSVYGNQIKVPFSETDDVSLPISPYAATKRSGELMAYTYHHLYGIEVACMRLFTVYGPRQRPDLAIHKFAQLALHRRSIPLYGDGNTRRDYTFVVDTVTGIRQLLHCPNLQYEIFNLGSGRPVSLLDMVHALEGALGRKLEVHFLPKQAGDVEQTFADVSKARRFFGYQPKTSLVDGVRQFSEWFYEQEADALEPA